MNRDSLVKYSLGIDVSGDSLECKLVAITSDQEVRGLAGYSFDNSRWYMVFSHPKNKKYNRW